MIPQIRKLYPDVLPQVERFERYIGCAGYYNGYLYNAYAMERQRQQSARSGGSGGMASSTTFSHMGRPVPQTVAVVTDPVKEIQRYKDLLDSGAITEEEFTAKKRQLLGL